ncbi:MAG: hypothetical protein AB4426_24570 [Xenococcaceae cyanobacterium]
MFPDFPCQCPPYKIGDHWQGAITAVTYYFSDSLLVGWAGEMSGINAGSSG